MNVALFISGVLTVLLVSAHSYLGERLLLGPLFRQSQLPLLLGSRTFARRTLRFAWHLTTVLGAGVGVWMMTLSFTVLDPQVIWSLRFFAVVFAACSLTSLIGTRGRHFSWYVLLAIAIAAWIGSL